MKSKFGIISIVVVLAIVLGGSAYAFYVTNQKEPESSVSKTKTDPSVAGDKSKYATLTGDKFDEAFIADMLAHHEGAVNMAEQAQAVTAHNEIRTLAGNITSSQSLEMMDMRKWQKEWGYEVTNTGGHMSHGGGGMQMAGDMIEMLATLKDLKGEEYDKEFLKQMILHHAQAIDMAQYANANAKHEEVKTLALNIISAQKSEVAQMTQWQKAWNYN